MAEVYGFLGVDSNGVPLQTPTKFVTQDVSGTPKNSPLAYSSSVVTLTVPDDAVQLILSPTTDLRVSDDVAMARYDVVVAGSKEAFSVGSMASVYIVRDTADGSVRFRFVKV